MSDTIRLCVQTHHPIDPGNYEGPIHCTACPEGTPCITALYVRQEGTTFTAEERATDACPSCGAGMPLGRVATADGWFCPSCGAPA